MPIKIAINGFGRIGRLVLRAWIEAERLDIKNNISIIAINDGSSNPTTTASEVLHLLRYDSLHGVMQAPCEVVGRDTLACNGHEVSCMRIREAQELDWRKLGIDIVLECSGAYKTRERAKLHLERGAAKVLISAPAKNPDVSIVVGVNDGMLEQQHQIVSALSCTTNCLAPIASVLQQLCGIERGFATTCHAYTPDQNLLDKFHKDPRRARAAALSIIPTSTGAANALALAIPELKGKILASSLRVPVANVSTLVFNCITQKSCSIESINQAMREKAKTSMRGTLAVCEEPLVSVDFLHRSESAIFDAMETKELDKNAYQTTAWYDNEWGFANRMLELAHSMGSFANTR